MKGIRIDPEFKALIFPLAEAEAALLEESLLAEGCRDALVTWRVRDGRHTEMKLRRTTMDKWHGGRELARFSKNSAEEVRLTLHDWGVGQYLDLRVFAKIRPSDDVPSNRTEAGLVLDVGLLPELRRAIDRAILALGGQNQT